MMQLNKDLNTTIEAFRVMAQNKNYKQRSGGNRNNNSRNNNNRNNNNYRKDKRDYPKKGGDNQSAPSRDNQAPPKEQRAAKPKEGPAAASNDLLWFFVVMILVAGGFLFNKFYLGPRRPGIYNSNYVSPPFKREGKLSFLDAQAGKNIVDLNIEIAKTPGGRNAGLKNRNFLPANGGFLYVYEDEAIRTFTMEGIFLSLDILFIDANQEIIRISRNTRPRSPASIPSGGKAQYVLQVQGGFCDSFTIRVGDHVEF